MPNNSDLSSVLTHKGLIIGRRFFLVISAHLFFVVLYCVVVLFCFVLFCVLRVVLCCVVSCCVVLICFVSCCFTSFEEWYQSKMEVIMIFEGWYQPVIDDIDRKCLILIYNRSACVISIYSSWYSCIDCFITHSGIKIMTIIKVKIILIMIIIIIMIMTMIMIW